MSRERDDTRGEPTASVRDLVDIQRLLVLASGYAPNSQPTRAVLGAKTAADGSRGVLLTLDDAAVRVADKARLVPLLGSRLSAGEIAVKREEFGRRLIAAHRFFVAQMEVFRKVATEVVSELAASSIPVLAIKGFALAHGVYRRDGERVMGDLDILVPRNAKNQAQKTIERMMGAKLKATADFQVGIRTRHGVPIDLHWELASRHRFKTDIDGLIDRARPGPCNLLYPDPNDQMVVLAIHFARSRMVAPFRTVIDGLALARANGASARVVATRAREAGAERAVGVWLGMLAEYGLNQGEWGDLARELGGRLLVRWLRSRALRRPGGKIEKEARVLLLQDARLGTARWIAVRAGVHAGRKVPGMGWLKRLDRRG